MRDLGLSFDSFKEDVTAVIIEGTEEGWPYGEIVDDFIQLMFDYEILEH